MKISFCTTVMNRLPHLKKTLEKNFRDNSDFNDLELVVLDYNSSDGLPQWMENNLDKFGGKVQYFRTEEPKFYSRSHSRNMAFRLATGEVLCNIDADNFAGKGFAAYLNNIFQENKQVFLAPEENSPSDTFGKICVRKEDFFSIRGYDEQIASYGFEDNDLKSRLTKINLAEFGYGFPEFLNAITHTEVERIKNEFLYLNTEAIFVKKINHFHSKMIFVLKDGSIESNEIIDTYYDSELVESNKIKPADILYRYKIKEGTFKNEKLQPQSLLEATKIKDKREVVSMIHFYSQLKNKQQFTENQKKAATLINPFGYGKGKVYKNLDESNPIILE